MLPGLGPEAGTPPPAYILLVEDEVLIRVLLAEAFRGEGFHVVEAASADEAWSYVQAGGRPDLVFSDLHMPGSMNGLELTRLIKAHYPAIKVFVTSGNPGPRRISEPDLFIAKPFRIDYAVKRARESLGLA